VGIPPANQPGQLAGATFWEGGHLGAWTPLPHPRQRDPHACRHMVGWAPDRAPLHALLTFAPGASNKQLEGRVHTEYLVEIPPSRFTALHLPQLGEHMRTSLN
jgi:hypothetical protein